MPDPMSLSAVMSIPRLDFSDCCELAWTTALQLGIPIRRRQGAFWHSTLTNAIEAAIAEDNPKYILTIDNDTVYTPDDVRELYRLMETHPAAAAIFPIQCGREGRKIMFTPHDDYPEIPWEHFEQELIPAASGHFGLTILRVSELKHLPKPWFICRPDEEGGWGPNRRDADARFWEQALLRGWQVFQANRVIVGHMQLVITYPGPALDPVHQYVNDWRKSGKPSNLWK